MTFNDNGHLVLFKVLLVKKCFKTVFIFAVDNSVGLLLQNDGIHKRFAEAHKRRVHLVGSPGLRGRPGRPLLHARMGSS